MASFFFDGLRNFSEKGTMRYNCKQFQIAGGKAACRENTHGGWECAACASAGPRETVSNEKCFPGTIPGTISSNIFNNIHSTISGNIRGNIPSALFGNIFNSIHSTNSGNIRGNIPSALSSNIFRNIFWVRGLIFLV
ncbi:MAG: hypothetical protein GY765_26930 [bacterium]|nr:hypothetical protein [bacterium]